MRENMKYDTNQYQLRETILRRMLQIINERKYCDEEGIVFYGDSIIEYFDLNKYFGNHKMIYNCGIAGISSSMLLNFIDEGVLKYKPSQVYILIGTNDLGHTEMKSPRDIALNVKEMVEIIHYNLPQTSIVLCSPIPCVESIQSYKVLNNGIRSNDMLKMIYEEYKRMIPYNYVTFINIFDCLCENDQCNPSYFIDGLHIKESGYQKIADILKKSIIK